MSTHNINFDFMEQEGQMALNRSPEFHCLIIQIVCVVVI